MLHVVNAYGLYLNALFIFALITVLGLHHIEQIINYRPTYN